MLWRSCRCYRTVSSKRSFRLSGCRLASDYDNRAPTKHMLTINEIFYSIQGESTSSGRPCVFVRLTACDLRCSWCDTPYAFAEGQKMSVDEVLAAVKQHDCPLVEITGGEPLLQEDVYELMDRLGDTGRTVM